ncbi:ninein [Triplophysa rosa]|uniref:ninein n=1 Tax=Triplophysa rosa TaxID=992332 RepID=UPI002545C577|nr:ninein [Triplophysa rosa]
MDGARDQYEERLKEVFESFDGSGSGSLCSEELTDLCRALQLEENTLNALLHALLHDQFSAWVDFEQFKDALILVLSRSNTEDPQECPEQPDSPEVQPRFVKGSKRYGRRTAPEFIHAHAESHRQAEDEDEKDEDAQTGDDRTVPRKRERWNADLSISEEFEAEGQLHLWNPDEPTTPIALPLCDLEERLHNACHQLSLPINGTATMQQLHMLCQHIGIELGEDLVQCSDGNSMDVQEFVSYIINHSKPPTPSASTPYRQLKRHHSTQFDESGRRISCALSSTIGLRLFSVLDDGSGHVPVETLLYRWMEEGVDNSAEILQALDFNSEDKVNLAELTVALENELLITKNSIHRAALVSFKAEIRHLLECVDLERREKERIRLDLDKAEKLKSQLASEVDDHHAAIERNNELNLRKLEQEYKDGMNALRAELSKEVELVQQQANQQREELENEMSKMKEEENFLREHLTLTIKENGRLEAELIDSMEKLVEAENQINKLQKNLDGVLKERFGDLDPDSAEFYQQENRLRHLHMNYEKQCRDLQDRIDELEAQLKEYQTLGHPPSTRPGQSLSEELANTSPDPDSQKQQILNMSLETEMLLEQHQREMESLRAMVYEEKRSAEEERSRLSLQHHQEMQVLREEMATQLKRVHTLEQELSGLHALHQQEISSFTQEAQDARNRADQLEEQLAILEEKRSACEEQSRGHADEIGMMELKHQEMLETCLQEQKERLQEEKKMQGRLAEQWEQERECLQKRHDEVLRTHLEETQQRKEQECVELERRLKEEWERERLELEKGSKETLQVMLEEKERKLREKWQQEKQELEEVSKVTLQAMLEERRERERRFREKWDEEHALLEKEHYDVLLQRLEEERESLRAQQEETERTMMEHWERERAQLEKQHEEVLHACLEQERERVQAEREAQERRWQKVLKEEQSRMEETHREAMLELSAKHGEERERLGSLLENLRTDIAQERRELETQFSQRLKEVEDRFCDDQEAVSECFQLDVCKLQQHYQSETAALKQQHAADCARWEEGSESAVQEGEQQQKLLRQVLDLEREQLKMEHQQLELTHAQDIKTLTDKNVQLQAELESFISAAQSKEIALSCQLNELHNHLQESKEAKDLMLALAEHKAAELEAMLQQAVDDFIQERVELQKSLSALESKRGEGLYQSMELKIRIQESEELLCQAAEDLRNERLELEEKLKESISLLMAKEEERVALLAEKDTLALKVVQLEEMLVVLRGTTEGACKDLFAEPCTVTAVEISADTEEDLEGPTQETSKEPVDESNENESFINEHLKSSGGITENTMHINVRFSTEEDFMGNDEAETVDEVANPEIGVNKQEVTTSDACADHKDTADVESANSYKGSLTEEKEKNEPKHAVGLSIEEIDVYNDAASSNAESNITKAQDEADGVVADSDLTKLENTTDKTTVEFEKATFCNLQGSECDDIVVLDGTEMCGAAIENTESLGTTSIGKHKEWTVNIPDASETHILAEESLRHQEFSDPDDAASIASLQNQIKALTEVCAPTSVNMELVSDMKNMCMQEILDLQEMVMQYSRAAEFTSFLNPELQDLERVPPKPCELNAHVDTDFELTKHKNCYELQMVESNRDSEGRIKSLEGKMHIVQDFHKQQMSVLEESTRLRADNCKPNELLKELEKQDEIQQWDSDFSDSSDDSFLELNIQVKEKIGAMANQELFNMQILKKQNSRLRQVLADLQGKSLRIHKQMQERRSEVCHLAKENLILRHRISTVREEDLRENQENLRLQHMKQGKRAAQALRRQLSEPRRLEHHLDEENVLLQLNADHVPRHTSQEVMRPHDHSPANEKNGLFQLFDREDFVSRKEKELLRAELNRCIEKGMSLESSLQTLTQQNAHLKSDLRITQQERDALKQEVISLHKQMQSANEKLLEVSVVSAGQQQGRRLWAELSGLMEAEHASLMDENQRLKRQMSEMNSELQRAREQICQLEALSLKLRALVKVADQEKSALKRELDALHSQLISTRNKTQRAAVLPSSPLQLPGEQRGQHHSDGPDFTMQDEREVALLHMEDRMREVEVTLRNLKLLLQEKVSQLKEQLTRNSEADVLIKDLYVENAQLLKALEKTEQRQKVAEKKNFLLEEKISSLNKIVRDLGPSPLTPTPYHFTRS